MNNNIFAWVVVLYILLSSSVYTHAGIYGVKDIPNVRLTSFSRHVSNPDSIISESDVAAIDQALSVLEDSMRIEVAVVAVKSIGNNDARMFATELFNYWGIGRKGTDNGLLIQLVTDPSQRSVVFETGYGLEEIMPDAICYRLQQQYMIPDMESGNYSEGVRKGVLAVMGYLMANETGRSTITGIPVYEEDFSSDNSARSLVVAFFVIVFSAPFLFIFLKIFRIRRTRKCPQCNKKTLKLKRYKVISQATYAHGGIAELKFVCSTCNYKKKKQQPIPRKYLGGGGSGRSFGGRSYSSRGGSWGGGRSGGGGSISRF